MKILNYRGQRGDFTRSGRIARLCGDCGSITLWICSSTLLVLVFLFLGFITGFIILLIFQFYISPPFSDDRRNGNIDSPTLRGELMEQVAKRNVDETSRCVLPLGTDAVTLGKETKTPYTLVVYREDDFLSSEIMKKGFWEIRSVGEMADLAPSMTIPPAMRVEAAANTTFYDFGANIGYYSFLFAASGYTVIAFEPEMSNVALFRASLCLNEWTGISQRITLLEHALSGENSRNCTLVGRVTPRRRKYLHSIPRLQCGQNYRCHPKKDMICQRDVPVTTLTEIIDEHFPKLPLPDIVKLDAEGHELPILESLFAPSSNDRPHLQPKIVQYENTNSRAAPLIAALLTAKGYTIGTKRGHDSNTIAEFMSPSLSRVL
jgi:FkbM family methyltransferase